MRLLNRGALTILLAALNRCASGAPGAPLVSAPSRGIHAGEVWVAKIPAKATGRITWLG
jgi:hypothetical protein